MVFDCRHRQKIATVRACQLFCQLGQNIFMILQAIKKSSLEKVLSCPGFVIQGNIWCIFLQQCSYLLLEIQPRKQVASELEGKGADSLNTTLAKKNRYSQELHEVDLKFDHVIPCDIELRFDIDKTLGVCASWPRVADRSRCRMRSHDRTADQSHEYLSRNDFFGQDSSIDGSSHKH